MYRVVAATPEGGVTLWRTPGRAVEGAPPPPGALLTPWGRRGASPPPARPPAAPLAEPAEELLPPAEEYCARMGMQLEKRRKIMQGDVLFVKQGGTHLVVKRQTARAPVVSVAATPGPASCELQALAELNRLMATRRLAPVFCELAGRPAACGGAGAEDESDSPPAHPVMRRYVTDLADWASCPTPAAPAHGLPADPGDVCLYTSGAGLRLATSAHASDRRLFNNVLREALLQVFLGLAQAARHALFSHNDLHAANVMFEHSPAGLSRLVVSGCGCFLLPRRAARVRIIDFQHACFTRGRGPPGENGSGGEPPRVCGGRADVHNSFALVYDVWRLCSNLLLEVLKNSRGALEADVLDLLRQGCGLASGAPLPPRMDAEVHWRPYLLDGPTAEEMLLHPAFGRFRCAPEAAAADEVYFERAPSAEAQDRFLRVLLHRHQGFPKPPPPPPRVLPPGAQPELLAVFARNYEGTAMGFAVMSHKHSPAARARSLFIELCLLEALLDHLWGPACEAEVARRAGDVVATCALADAIGVVLHADYTYIARPEAMADYNAAVLEAARLPCVLEAAAAPPGGCRLSPREQAQLLDVRVDGDLERFRGVFVRAVLG